MNGVYGETKRRFIILKGEHKYDKLFNAVKNSNAMTKVIGLSVKEKMIPTLADLRAGTCMIPYVYFQFDDAVNSMSELIMLKIWNEEVNDKYHLCPDYILTDMALHIKKKSIHLDSYL